MSSLLFGHNADERIVAVRQRDERTMRVYFRLADRVRHEDAPFFPFLHVADRALLEGFQRKHWLKGLEGDGFYRFLCVVEDWICLWEAVRHVLDRHNRFASEKAASYTDLASLHLVTDPVAQYLLQTGRTLFKGMEFPEVVRLQLDIETYTTPPHRFSNPERPNDRIILIALADSSGWTAVLDGKKLGEAEMLAELVRIVQERDPDVIEGHNIYGFDLPYILTRCTLHGITPALGRDGALPQVFETRQPLADRSFDLTVTDIPGRHIIDTLLLVQSYDAVKRNMEGHGLKDAARYFGLSSPDRVLIPGERIAWYWDNNPGPLTAYALDDVRETGALSERLSGSSFYLSRMLPYPYGHAARLGSAAKIESLLLREYLRAKHSLPRPQQGQQTSGGYTDLFTTGVVGPVLHVDVESLYPSVMITRGICPASDRRRVFPELLRALTALRLDTKRAMTAARDSAARSRLDAMQSSFKILINSFYGYLGYARGLFNDFEAADTVTRTGQALLRDMMAQITARGGTVVEVDTDGVFFVPPDDIQDEASELSFVEALSRSLPEGINVALDGRYRRMFSYKKKNYALLGYDGQVTIRGSSLMSRSMERFGRTYLRESIERLLADDIDGLHALYLTYARRIQERKLDVRDFARTETLHEDIEEYRRAVEAGKRNRSAAYEVAIAQGGRIRPGTRVSYYIVGTDPAPRGFESCRHASEWDSNFPDENSAFYLRRLDEFAAKFKEVFEAKDYRDIFSSEDLFPFSSQGIRAVVRLFHEGAEEDGGAEPAEWGE